MQPLALQKAPVTAETGDSSGPSSASASGAHGVLFSDLMTAAQPSQTIQGSASNPDVAPEEDADQVDQDLAALAAATQIATRGVTLKTSTPTAISTLKDGAPVQAIAVDETAADVPATGDLDSTETTDHDPRSQQDLQTTDGGELNVQALINIAMTAAITQPKEQLAAASEAGQTELKDLTASSDHRTLEEILAAQQVADLQQAPASKAKLPSETHLSSANEESDGGVNLSTMNDVAIIGSSSQTNDQTEAQHQTGLQSTKIAALQAVAWFDGAPSEPSRLDAQSGDTIDQITLAEASGETSATNKDRLLAVHEPLATSPQAVGPVADLAEDEGQSATNAIDDHQAISDKRKREEADLAEPAALTPLPLQATLPQAPQLTAHAESQNQQSDALTSSTTPTASDPHATQRTVNAPDAAQSYNLTTSASSTAGVGDPNQHSEPTSDRSGAANAALLKEAGLLPHQRMGGDGQDSATVVAPPTDETTLEAEHRQGKADWTTNKNSPQDPDVHQTDLAELKRLHEKDDATKIESVGKADVNIREILKLGATDVALSFEQPDLPAAQQLPAEQPLPPQASSNQQVTPLQAAPLSTTNVETNGEKRTIADDIRLRALERMVVNAARNGTQILSIQLYPPGLGQVVLRLAMDGQRLRLATRAATTEAADTLRNMEADLRDALAGNGLQLAGFDVSEDGTNDEAPRRQPVEPLVKTRSDGTKESFIVDLNA